ncbi:MAG: hypothetical protein QOH93_2554 [Chloroflexia bacterium]|jgi:predicted dehydrogenase|nr:hypothetical protein [Chloroflexia bacterium]
MSDGGKRQLLRLGIIGCGKVVEKYHLPALKRSKTWTLSAACDPSPERRLWVQGAAPGVPVYQRHTDLLEASLDAVLIATPPMTHSGIAIEALGAGLHVLVEKPMSLSVEEARSLIDAATASGRLLLVGFNRRFHPTYVQLRAQLQRPNAEQVRSLTSNFIFDAGAWGAHLGDEAAGGGVLDDVVCHQADLLCWLLGKRAVRVAATPVSEAGTETREVEYQLDFGGGFVARCTAGHGTEYHEDVIVGTGGKMLVARPGRPPVEAARSSLSRLWEAVGAATNRLAGKIGGRPSMTVESFKDQLEAFAWSIRAGVPHQQSADASSGLYSVMLVDAARKSPRSGGDWQEIPSTMETGA